MITLDVYNTTSTKIPKQLFMRLLKPIHRILIAEQRILAAQNFSLELSLIGDRKMRAINRRFHNKDRSTDVISLSYFNDSPLGRTDLSSLSCGLIGEIFISIPFAGRQARKIHQSLREELRFLFIHGVLHVFGYDHKKAREKEHMNRLTYRILGRE